MQGLPFFREVTPRLFHNFVMHDTGRGVNRGVASVRELVGVQRVPVVGLEPTHPHGYKILSLARLPFHHTGKCAFAEGH